MERRTQNRDNQPVEKTRQKPLFEIDPRNALLRGSRNGNTPGYFNVGTNLVPTASPLNIPKYY